MNDFRVGEKRVCNNDLIAEIIAYRNHKDIDIKYEDGLIMEHVSYNRFFQGGLARKDKKAVFWRRRIPSAKQIGKKKRTLFGHRELLNVYRDRKVDYVDDDGKIVKRGSYYDFLYKNTFLVHYKNKDGSIYGIVH